MSEEIMFSFEEDTSINLGPTKNTKTSKLEETETSPIIRQTYLVTDEIRKALKIKAITEDIQLNVLVRKILKDAIEAEYFEKL